MSSSVSLVNPTTEIGELTGFPCKPYNRDRWIHRFPLCSTIPRSALGDGPFAPKNPPETIPARSFDRDTFGPVRKSAGFVPRGRRAIAARTPSL